MVATVAGTFQPAQRPGVLRRRRGSCQLLHRDGGRYPKKGHRVVLVSPFLRDLYDVHADPHVMACGRRLFEVGEKSDNLIADYLGNCGDW
jgi:hypothetical protein